MIVHRFMSDKEYRSLLGGETLKNTTVHSSNGYNSSSVGFCFFTEQPDKAIHWLSFIVCSDWCVTFNIPDNMLTKSRALYRDPEKDTWYETAAIYRDEYCLKEYSIKTVEILKADNQWANYKEDMIKEFRQKTGPFGELLLKLWGIN